MEASPQQSALFFLLSLPLRHKARLWWIGALGVVTAVLRAASLAALLPLLKVLLAPDWRTALNGLVQQSPAFLQPALEPAAEHLAAGAAMRALWILLGCVLALTLVRSLVQIYQEWLAARLVHAAVAEVALEMHDQVLKGAGEALPDGAILTSFTVDLDALRVCLRRLCGKILREPLHVVVTVYGLFLVDSRLAWWTCALFPLPAFVVLALSRKLRAVSRASLQRTAEMVSLVEEALRGRRVVRAFGLEPRERERFAALQDELTTNLVRLDCREAASGPVVEILGLLAAAGCIVLGAQRVFNAQLDAASFLTFYMVLLSMLDPLRKTADTQVRVQRALAATRRIQELFASTPPLPPIHGEAPFQSVREELEFHETSVRAGDAVLLERLSFRVRSGETVLVAGPSGAGKSTLIDVLGGLRRYASGHVLLDGVELRALRAVDYMERVGLVAQDTFLFRGSLRENLALSRPPRGITLQRAVELADLESLLAALPRGLETKVEDRRFSAGERQRLSIARALYRDPALLLLDEATSALDRPTEERILDRLLKERRGECITFLVTHRLSRDLAVDQVLLLENGGCAKFGTPQELLSHSALYRNLLLGVQS